MPPRVELALGVALFLLLGIGAAALGSRRARVADTDPRRSTYLAGPSGARGFAEALERLDVEVVRHRRPIGWLDTLAGPGTLVAVLQPSAPLTAVEARQLAELEGDLLLAGHGADRAMACLGYRVWPRSGAAVILPPPGAEGAFPRTRQELVRHHAREITDSSAGAEGPTQTCAVPEPVTVDTLLRSEGDRVVALTLEYESGRRVTLVAESALFANRALRETAAGPFVLGLVAPRYSRVLVDELHHGYQASGSLAGAAVEWSLGSPWGWAGWQLAVVGLLALLAAGVRLGPARRVIVRRRRSPLEHVRALATALAATRGHDVAVRLMVQGLRRRLSRSGRPDPGDLHAWLDGLASSLRSGRGRAAHAELATLIRRSGGAEEVLRAAHAVETMWEELKPR